MINAQAVINAICEAHNGPPEELPGYIGEEYQDVLNLSKNLRGIANRRSIAEKEYDLALAILDQEATALQHGCAHWTTTFFPDAAGGSQSYTECDICGAEL